MTYKTVESYVEVEVDLSEWSDQELVEEMESRGYTCVGSGAGVDEFEREDWDYILKLLDNSEPNLYTRSIREKVRFARFGQ